MALHSQVSLSKVAGVTKSAIGLALKRGMLRYKEGKKIDDNDPLTIAYLKNKKRKGKKSTSPNIIEEREKKTEVNKPKEITADTVTRINNENLDLLSKDDLDRAKIAEDIRIKRIKHQRERGELIDREFVKTLFLKLYNIDVNEFLQLSASLSAKICDIIGETDEGVLMEVNKTIDNELYKTQSHIKIEVDKFLNDMEKNIIKDE